MRKIFHIKRTEYDTKQSFWQDIEYEYDNEKMTVAAALFSMNEDKGLLDMKGEAVGEIKFSYGCLQKRCGACAMRINEMPALACDTFLSGLKGKTVKLEPLRKFPVIEDLVTDRSVIFKNMKTLGTYRSGHGSSGEDEDALFDSASCLSCGLCLEVCPNFYPEGEFFGTQAAVSYYRKLSEGHAYLARGSKFKDKAYKEHVYEGCAKSLSCRDICPAGIDIDGLYSRNNGMAVWNIIP